MCDIGFVILEESKRDGSSAPDFGYYLSRSARPTNETDYSGLYSMQNHEKAKRYTDYTNPCGHAEMYAGVK